MNFRRLIIPVLLVVVGFSVFPVSAQIPPLPHAFYGEVQINGNPAPEDTMVCGVIEEGQKGCIEVQSKGFYGGPRGGDRKLLVQSVSQDIGKTITFLVSSPIMGGEFASQTVIFQPGEVEKLDLTVTSTQEVIPTPTVVPTPTLRPVSGGGSGGGSGVGSGVTVSPTPIPTLVPTRTPIIAQVGTPVPLPQIIEIPTRTPRSVPEPSPTVERIVQAPAIVPTEVPTPVVPVESSLDLPEGPQEGNVLLMLLLLLGAFLIIGGAGLSIWYFMIRESD